METLSCSVELREAKDGPMLRGILIQEGRVASERKEIFAPLSLVWASDGIALRAKHLGVEDSRAIPTREANGEIRIAAPASAALVAAFNEGRRFFEHRISRAPGNQKQVRSAGNPTSLSSRRGARFRARVFTGNRRSTI